MPDNLPSRRMLIDRLRELAAEYRRWANDTSVEATAEYARLADDVDRTIAELERHFGWQDEV